MNGNLAEHFLKMYVLFTELQNLRCLNLIMTIVPGNTIDK